MSDSNNVKEFKMSLNDFQSLLSTNPNKIYFLYFMAHWCGPCKLIKSFIYETADNFIKGGKDIEFYMVVSDDGDNEELVQHYNVNALPTFIIFKGEEIHSSIVGAQKDKLTAAINESLVK